METQQVEELFVLGMNELKTQGLNFDEVVRATLRDIFGETPSDVLFLAFGKLTESPKTFASKMSLMFPEGTVVITLDLVAKRAQASLTSPGTVGENSQYDALIRQFGLMPGIKPSEKKPVLLHDQREEDELDRAVGHKTT